MALQYLAGQRLTADALQRAVPDRVVQEDDQSVTSSITLVDSAIEVTVDGLLLIDLLFRWQSNGGGIRWAWADAGSVTSISRATQSAGSAATGTPDDLTSARFRAGTVLSTVLTIAHFQTGNAQQAAEQIVVDGSGTMTLQFAQETSNAGATTLFAESYAIITRLGS